MPAVNWTDDLSVGVHIIDADHKMLIDLINQLADAVKQEEHHEKINGILTALYDYTDFHFMREEALMEACGYSEIEAHRKVHDHLRGRVRDIRDLHTNNPSMVLDNDLMAFMTEWLTKHIMGHDKHYSPSMNGKEREIAEAHRTFVMEGAMAPSGDATE